MKTSVFNLRRVGLLFQRYFIERFWSEVMYWGIMAIVFMFFRNNIPGMFGLILVASVLYAARFFKEIHHSGNGVAYFMIPATQLEKLTVSIVITTFYYFAMMMVVYAIGNMVGTFLNNMLAFMNLFFDIFNAKLFDPSPLQWLLFSETSKQEMLLVIFGTESIKWIVLLFITFLMIQPLFFLGSIYFKKNQAFKTILVIVLFYLFLAILFWLEVKYFLVDDATAGKNMKIWGIIALKTVKCFYSLLPLFLWVVSYFRLTEKQV